MASMLTVGEDHIRILDPGAGVGSLFVAAVEELLSRRHPKSIHLTAYEIDSRIAAHTRESIRICTEMCSLKGVDFVGEVMVDDFMMATEKLLRPNLFETSDAGEAFNCVIMNPPYGKLGSSSVPRLILRRLGLETGNLYTGFVYLATRLLAPGGDLVAIVPRSFANGPYFEPFRKWFLSSVALDRIHVFNSREAAFKEDSVLQENIIIHGLHRPVAQHNVRITSSDGPTDDFLLAHDAEPDAVVQPDDPSSFIRLLTDGISEGIDVAFRHLPARLADLGVQVSTGRVVDFRAREYLTTDVTNDTVPLIYPHDLSAGWVSWPNRHPKKSCAMRLSAKDKGLLISNGHYVLVKRFTSKEERKRLVAGVSDPMRVPATFIGIENHLNYFHQNGGGLSAYMARGLAAYLNSTFADMAFRLFSGHTQVNAADLRNMRYPSRDQLELLGARIPSHAVSQEVIDELVSKELPNLVSKLNPVNAKKKIDQALAILKAIGLPTAQQNERSALTLLALLDLKPASRWREAGSPLIGITPMMEFFRDQYGKEYAPNTRETVRRQTVHQFVDAGIVVPNPDDPERPTNSPKAVYQIESSTLDLVRTFGDEGWEAALAAYLASSESLAERYRRVREMSRIPVTIRAGETLLLSPGGQNILVEQIIHEFAPRFTPGGEVLYVGDTGEKFAYFDVDGLRNLGVAVDPHGKMPDVIIHFSQENWLVLIEAVTSHGPVDPKRREELERLFNHATAGLVFVTAFLTRKALTEYLVEISWETEVWVADAPDHLIHFNGERFLGPR
jgi:adenine-specific DNA-methyltransferase